MEEFASLWSYQENIDVLKEKLLYTTIELEAVKAETNEEMRRNTESMKQLLHMLKIACQERDEAKDQLQKLLNKFMSSNDQQMFNVTNASVPNCFDQVQQPHQGALMMPAKAHSSITESNSLSEAYNQSSPPVDSLFDPISSPEFSNINVETTFVQDYNQNVGFSNGLNGSENVQKVDQATLVMENMIKGKTLPQKGSFLQAVVEAGPLLQNLLLAGPLPRWRNPPPLKSFHIPPMMAAVDQTTTVQKQDVTHPNKLLTSPTTLLKQSQPYAEMACGSSSQMMAGGCIGGSGGVLSFGDVNFQGRMMAACPGGGTLGSIAKRQRLH
ncbi:hypothetical protein M8C21_014505 [Ambrosia artemisiifolia]|uniref:Uncharacterized protein n=1 Tax=Ambrosia artemisiifolia TaxID=4212 RepID=A0AAD5C3P3_AMBAR|nr:hypothetical protein M8C21_014505 [Ambrosia artemisiifolia]